MRRSDARWHFVSFLIPAAFSAWGAVNAAASALEYLAAASGWAPWYVAGSFAHLMTIAGLWALWRLRMLRDRLTRQPPDHVG